MNPENVAAAERPSGPRTAHPRPPVPPTHRHVARCAAPRCSRSARTAELVARGRTRCPAWVVSRHRRCARVARSAIPRSSRPARTRRLPRRGRPVPPDRPRARPAPGVRLPRARRRLRRVVRPSRVPVRRPWVVRPRGAPGTPGRRLRRREPSRPGPQVRRPPALPRAAPVGSVSPQGRRRHGGRLRRSARARCARRRVLGPSSRRPPRARLCGVQVPSRRPPRSPRHRSGRRGPPPRPRRPVRPARHGARPAVRPVRRGPRLSPPSPPRTWTTSR